MKYLETTNYRDFESFISSAPYQVIILGHSCALSDNTLLRTLFEHENCVSVKPYSYEETNKEEKWDNYHEIIQSLSRCFTDEMQNMIEFIHLNLTYWKISYKKSHLPIIIYTSLQFPSNTPSQKTLTRPFNL